MTRFKVCCIASPAEAQLAISAGASALGLVSAMPSGPGVISEELVAEIARGIPPGVSSFLLTSARRVDAVADQVTRLGVDTVQLVDDLEEGELPRLRAALPRSVRVVQVIHVLGPQSVDAARASAEQVDAILLDSGNPGAAVKELGGTGRVHDWSVSRAIREAIDVPLWLAGGLNPDNVAAAVQAVAPFGVDVCSGLRTENALDSDKLTAFASALSCAQVAAGAALRRPQGLA